MRMRAWRGSERDERGGGGWSSEAVHPRGSRPDPDTLTTPTHKETLGWRHSFPNHSRTERREAPSPFAPFLWYKGHERLTVSLAKRH
jgi:hypothetical protein